MKLLLIILLTSLTFGQKNLLLISGDDFYTYEALNVGATASDNQIVFSGATTRTKADKTTGTDKGIISYIHYKIDGGAYDSTLGFSYALTPSVGDTTYLWYQSVYWADGTHYDADAVDTLLGVLPTELAIVGDINELNLTWTDPANSDFQKVNIYAGFTDDPTVLLASVDAGEEAYQDSGISAGLYYIRLESIDNSGNAWGYTTSVNDTVFPKIPVLTAVADDDTSRIDITNSVDIGDSIRIYAGNSDDPTTWIGSKGTSDTYSHTGLTEDTIYYYRGKRIENGISSDYSSSVSDTTTILAPTNFSATGDVESANLSWINNSTAGERLIVMQSDGDNENYANVDTLAVDSTNCSITGLSASSTYYFKLKYEGTYSSPVYSNEYSCITEPATYGLAYSPELNWGTIDSTSITIGGIDSSIVDYDTLITGTVSVADSNLETSASFPLSGSYTGTGQSFTASATGVIDSIAFWGEDDGTPTGDAYCKLYKHSGTYGTSSVPGTLIASSIAKTASGFSNTQGVNKFYFSADSADITKDSLYVLTVEHTGDASNFINVYGSGSSTHGGNRCRYPAAGPWGARSAEDMYFVVYGTGGADTTITAVYGDYDTTFVYSDSTIGLVVQNLGNYDNTISAFTGLALPFDIDDSDLPVTLGAGVKDTFNVSFRYSYQRGSYTDKLIIDNSGDNDTLDLSGTLDYPSLLPPTNVQVTHNADTTGFVLTWDDFSQDEFDSVRIYISTNNTTFTYTANADSGAEADTLTGFTYGDLRYFKLCSVRNSVESGFTDATFYTLPSPPPPMGGGGESDTTENENGINTWFVDGNVGSSGNGTTWANAWKTWAGINWASISAGDTIYVSGGWDSLQYNETFIPGKTGTSGNVILITKGKSDAHNGTVIIDGQNTRTQCIRNYGLGYNYITFDGFTCRNATGDGNGWIRIEGSSVASPLLGITLKNITISNATQTGIRLRYCTNTVIDNYDYESVTSSSYTTDGIAFYDCVNTTVQYSSIIIRNNNTATHDDCIQKGAYTNATDGGTIRFNFFSTPNTDPANAQGIYLEMVRGTWNIYGNVIDGGEYVKSLIYPQKNYAGIEKPTINVYNNTIISGASRADNMGAMRYYTQDSLTVNFYNNIVVSTDANSPLIDVSGGTFNADYNMWYAPNMSTAWDYGTWTTWRSTHDTHGYNTNPSLTNYQPVSITDPPVDKGSTLGAPYNVDIVGTSRPQGDAYDIGAYEYVSTGDVTPPSAPSSLVATADNDTAKIRLTWTDPADADVDSIIIYRGLSTDPTTRIDAVNNGIQAYTDVTTSQNTTYYYRVTAKDTAGNISGYSSNANATTPVIIDTLRPTATLTDAVLSTNPSYAYDNSATTYCQINPSIDYLTGDGGISWGTWGSATFSYSSLTLYVTYEYTSTAVSDLMAIQYSTNGGTSWSDLRAYSGAAQSTTTISATLSASQDLSALRIRLLFDRVSGDDGDLTRIYNIYTVGTE